MRGSTLCRTPQCFVRHSSRYFLNMVDTIQWYITCFYRFVSIPEERVDNLREEIRSWMDDHQMRGLVLVSTEGLNGTVSGDPEVLPKFKQKICEWAGTEVHFKDSQSNVRPFRRLSVDKRLEIVGMKRPDLVPDEVENHHLTPKEWHEMLSAENPPLLIDTRNKYETLAGKFVGAVDPQIDNFSDWGKYLDSAEIPKEEPVLIYCTGGIRCEKAILEMHQRGFEKVYQLRDGIIGYLAEYPNGLFDGDCYVFDERVALDQNLKPTTRLGNCPGCGLTAEIKRTCEYCGKDYFVCTACQDTWEPVCNKTCRDRWQHVVRKKNAKNQDPLA